MTEPGEITLLLEAIGGGDAGAYSTLMGAIYDELRAMAAGKMRHERADHTLQATALVNEVYMRLSQGQPEWQGRGHFFAAAAEAMRRILVEHARRKGARKRGGDLARITLGAVDAELPQHEIDLIALDEALDELEKTDSRGAQVVQLRFFAGLSVEETAQVLETSPATVKRDWTFARAWLLARIDGSES